MGGWGGGLQDNLNQNLSIFHHKSNLKTMSPDTGFKVLTPAEVAADEEGKDPEQFGFDVSFRKAMSQLKRSKDTIHLMGAPL